MYTHTHTPHSSVCTVQRKMHSVTVTQMIKIQKKRKFIMIYVQLIVLVGHRYFLFLLRSPFYCIVYFKFNFMWHIYTMPNTNVLYIYRFAQLLWKCDYRNRLELNVYFYIWWIKAFSCLFYYSLRNCTHIFWYRINVLRKKNCDLKNISLNFHTNAYVW